jgi:hypothetical protein
MDINGAKALKKRLGQNGGDEAPPAVERADIPAEAPPVYHWTGKTPAEAAPSDVEEDDPPRRAALFSHLSLDLR